MATMVGSAEALARRVDALRAKLDDLGLDAFVATSRPAYMYLTGFAGEGYERLIAAVVSREATTLIVPALEEDAAVEQSAGADLRVWRDGEDPLVALAELVAAAGSSPRLGVEEKALSLEQADRLRADVAGATLEHAGSVVEGLRLHKDDHEVDGVRRAGALLGDAFTHAFDTAEVGKTEVALQGRLELGIGERGGSETISLVQIGERAALPHGAAGDRELARGDVILIDAATTVNGYWGDITRCATIGAASDEVKEVWDVVAAAYAAGVAAVGPGVNASDVDRAARAVIDDAGYGEAFIHRTGHGLGLEVHEAPYLSGTSDEVLEPGMIVTVEPGIYLRDRFGLRLENDVLVTESGAEVLTHAPEELREL